MSYTPVNTPNLMDSIINMVAAGTGWGGIEFLFFCLMVLVMVLLFKFVARY